MVFFLFLREFALFKPLRGFPQFLHHASSDGAGPSHHVLLILFCGGGLSF